ncbi:MAG: extracellular solute-binding protein, partial [Chloroflexi bacterium]|nr:extracellular solute-binding protein [Chloroflexota bacterium]
MSNKLTRREFLRAAGIAAAGVTAATALGACAPQATPAPKADGSSGAPAAKAKVVEWLAWGGPTDIEAAQKAAAEFGKQFPDYILKLTIGPWGAVSGSPFYTKVQTMVAGGVPPDVSWFQGWEWQPYADKGVLLPVDDYLKRDPMPDIYPDYPAVHDSTERSGKTWMVPTEQPTMVMFYAKKHFDEAGIPYPTDDWTLEEFLDLAVKLTDTSGAVKKYGYQANGMWPRDIHWIRSTGKQEFDTIIDPKKMTFNQPEIVEMVQLIASDVYYKYKVSPTPADLEGGANTIDTGNCAMKYEGPWFFPNLNSPKLREQGKQVEFDVVLMPKCQDGSRPHRAVPSGLLIMKTDRDPEDAW